MKRMPPFFSKKNAPHRNDVKTILLTITAIAALAGLGPPSVSAVHAAETKLTPSLAGKAEYNDNLFVTAANQVDDTITTLSPGIIFLRRNDRGRIEAIAGLDLVRYADHNELDSTDKEVNGSGSYSLSERLLLGVDGGWSRNSRLDSDLETTGLVYSAARRTRHNYNLSCRWQASETEMLQLAAGQRSDRYSDPEYSNLDGTTARLTWTGDFSRHIPQFVGQALLDYGRYEYPTAEVETYTVGLGGQMKISDLWSINGWMGPSSTETTYLSGAGTSTTKKGISGSLGLDRQLENGTIGLAVSQSVSSDSGRDGTVTRSTVSTTYKQKLTADFSMGLELRYFRNNTDAADSARSINEHNYQITPRVSYRLSDDIELISYYQHMYIDDRDDGVSRRRNLVFMKAVFTHAFPL